MIFKLKEMGKFSKKDISMFLDQFDQQDFAKCEKISLADIIGRL
jgi:potassium channel subfamily K, other eukaryote